LVLSGQFHFLGLESPRHPREHKVPRRSRGLAIAGPEASSFFTGALLEGIVGDLYTL
jgi:hypothetical protein